LPQVSRAGHQDAAKRVARLVDDPCPLDQQPAADDTGIDAGSHWLQALDARARRSFAEHEGVHPPK
jgi:hypothetical protein